MAIRPFTICDDAAPARMAQDFIADAHTILDRSVASYARPPGERAAIHKLFSYTDVVLRKALDPENAPGARALAAVCAGPALAVGLVSTCLLLPPIIADEYMKTRERRVVSGLHNQRRALRGRINAFDKAIAHSGIRWECLSAEQQQAALRECSAAAKLLNTHGPQLGMRHPAKGVEEQLNIWRAKCYTLAELPAPNLGPRLNDPFFAPTVPLAHTAPWTLAAPDDGSSFDSIGQ